MTLKELFSQATTPANKTVIENFLITASDVNDSTHLIVKTDYFIEQMIHKYGICRTMEYLDIEPTISNFPQIFTRCFGTGAALTGTYKALLKYAELTLGGKKLIISGDSSDDTTSSQSIENGGDMTRTLNTGNTESGTNTTSSTIHNTGTDTTTTEDKLGAWDDTNYKGASYSTETETKNLTDTESGTTTIARTTTQTGTITDADSRTMESNSTTEKAKEYREEWEEIGGTPEYISLYNNPNMLNLAESFCYYFVKMFCRTCIEIF